jgi:HEPN domain-containing protein
MGRIEEMLVGASKDFDLAGRYRHAGEYTISVLLYTEAIEKIFKAMFVRRMRKEPPSGASIDYLAMRLHTPKEIFDDETLQYVDERGEQVKSADASGSAEERALNLEEVAKRLLDYSMACAHA